MKVAKSFCTPYRIEKPCRMKADNTQREIGSISEENFVA